MTDVLVDEDAYLDALMLFAAQGLSDHGFGSSLTPLPFVVPPAPSPARVGPVSETPVVSTASSAGSSDAGNTDDIESTVSSSPSRSHSDQELTRQEKARAKYRRIYHMRQVRRQTLRAQVAALESELAALTSQQGRASHAHPPHQLPPLQHLDVIVGRRSTNRRDSEHMLRELSLLKLQLKRDNAALRRQLHAFSASVEHMRDELFAEHRLWVANATTFTMLKRLTVPESLEIRSRALTTVADVIESTGALTPAGIVCGWAEMRGVRSGLIRFVLQKIFYRYSPEDVADRMFAILSDPRQIAKLYRSGLDVAFHFVQRVSDDCVMLLMEMTALPGHDAKITTIPLISRRKIATGFQILIQPLVTEGFPMENDRPMDSVRVGIGASDEGGLNDHCFGIMIEAAGGGNDSRMSFVGVAQTVESHTFFWLIEELLHCIRAEELMFGPRFSLPQSPFAASS